MKSIKKIFKNNLFFIIFFSGLGFIVFVTISYLLVLPSFLSFLSSKLENEVTKIEITDLEKNISDTKAIDKDEAGKLFSLVNNFIPESEDVLRSITLIEKVARFSGVTLDSFDTNTKQVVPGQDVTASPQAEGATPTQAVTAIPTSSSSYEMEVKVSGSFSEITKFITNFLKTDRLLGISDITLSSAEGGVSAQLTVGFPLSPATTTVVIGDDLVLTESEKKQLKEIEEKKFTANPSTDPLGPVDPFQ